MKVYTLFRNWLSGKLLLEKPVVIAGFYEGIAFIYEARMFIIYSRILHLDPITSQLNSVCIGTFVPYFMVIHFNVNHFSVYVFLVFL